MALSMALTCAAERKRKQLICCARKVPVQNLLYALRRRIATSRAFSQAHSPCSGAVRQGQEARSRWVLRFEIFGRMYPMRPFFLRSPGPAEMAKEVARAIGRG